MKLTQGFALGVFALAAVVLLPLSVADAKSDAAMYRISHVGRVVVGKPIEIGLDNKGVKLESVTFDGDSATVVVWNRTPQTVKGHIGLALYDRNNYLIAAASDSMSFVRTFTQIRAGKQASFTIKFNKFLTGFDGAAKYAVVFVAQM